MSWNLTQDSSEQLSQVHAMFLECLGDGYDGALRAFVQHYFAGVAADDLASRSVEDLYGSALAHWRTANERTAGKTVLKVYNPRLDEHGWQSTHSVIELVTDDMPFLVDSLRMAVNRLGASVHLVIHPVMVVERDASGRISQVAATHGHDDSASIEAVMQFEVDRQSDSKALAALRSEVEDALASVRSAVEDWQPMRQRLLSVVEELRASPPPLGDEELDEGIEFLLWLADDHFTFLGYREFTLAMDGDTPFVSWGPREGLGMHRELPVGKRSAAFDALPDAIKAQARERRLLITTKANARSRVHRPGYLDYVGVKRFDSHGQVVGEYRFIGLYTSAAYDRALSNIPLLRGRVRRVMESAGYPPRSHAGKALAHIIDTYPRDVVFQADDEELLASSMAVLHLQERPRVRLLLHPDRLGRSVTCVVYVPRDRFRTEIRLRIQDLLAEALGGEAVDFTVWLSESVLARIFFVVRLNERGWPQVDVRALEASMQQITRAWTDDLFGAVIERFGEAEGIRLYQRYGQAFRLTYRDTYGARLAVHDIEHMESIGEHDTIAMSLHRPLEVADNVLHFKLFQVDAPVPLSDALPVLEDMGLRVIEETPNKIKRTNAARVYLHDFGLTHSEGKGLDLDKIRPGFEQTFAAVWRGDAESDGFNRLVVRAGLTCDEIVVLRAYCKYMRQIRVPYSQQYIEQALSANPHIAALLIAMFKVRFDLGVDERERSMRLSDIQSDIEASLDAVANLDEDRIIRHYLALMLATVRTNFYIRRAGAQPCEALSFKFDCSAVPDMPEPRPLFEIFVYSPRVEGVHLRGSRVARGGLRWSDRPEDFRTEVLGLVKAQMVKNAVIVPMGSKGGFVPKRLPQGDRDAIAREGVACYQIFIRALLDLTDNLIEGEVAPPVDVVRHDDDDPYLVVAADKGTATFSDIANAIAVDVKFWLGDAFASGGSTGYDHKGMGITAKGAWESVKRHFREMGHNTQAEPFSVVGIGDMGGDVFGNGMLLSPHIQLVAAFNHLHIFLDPSPDCEASFAERKRLFELPRSAWTDYDASLISKGGGVFPRSAKSIRVSDEMAAVLDIPPGAMAPNELIRTLLKAPVDLVWNGGIGTYVKASSETDIEVGDRANDALRVNASDLRCRVVGEGGNLGFTQLSRVQFSSLGGHVYTDAIDNSAGVDCSDHEVNIKIALGDVVASGDMTEKQRNQLLRDMTAEVGELVVRNNYLQTQALSLAAHQAASMLDVHTRLMRMLEREARLDRHIEALPDADEIQKRRSAGLGLYAPELAVLMAYVKIHLYEQLVVGDFPKDDAAGEMLLAYFPQQIREGYESQALYHQLRPEIVATLMANEIVNREGTSFVFRLSEETGASAEDIARGYLAARDVYGMDEYWAEIEALDNLVSAAQQTSMLLEGRRLQERATRWLLRNAPRPLDITALVERYKGAITALTPLIEDMLPRVRAVEVEQATAKAVEAGLPQTLARRAALMPELFSVLDVVEVSLSTEASVRLVSEVYFALDDILELGWLRARVIELARDNRWQALSRIALREDLYALEAQLTAQIVRHGSDGEEANRRIEAWQAQNASAVERFKQVIVDVMAGPTPDFPMLTVIMNELRTLGNAR